MDSPDSRQGRSLKAGHRRPTVWLPLSFLVTATALILIFDLDLRFQRLFFTADGGWWLQDRWFLPDFFEFGTWPAIGLIGAAALTCLLSIPIRSIRRWLRPALFLVLVAGIGPGLVINGIFKEHFGRPRPRTIQEFGRYQEYLPLLKMGASGRGEQGTSFPSGHAAMGFYLLSPYFFLLDRRRHLARLALFTGLVAGSLIGLSRTSAGDHFLGDILWSWGFVYFSGLLFYYLVRLHRHPAPDMQGTAANGRYNRKESTERRHYFR